MKFQVTHLVTVEVDAENADMAARKLSIVPSMAEYEEVGKVIRTHWLTEFIGTEETVNGRS